MSFFVAINVLCAFLTSVVPLASLFLIIFLPLTSAIVEVMCKDRWFPIYAFATLGLSIVVSLSSIDFTIFYIVPSIFTGYIFGLFSKRNLPPMFSIFIAACIQTILSFVSIFILKAITNINIIDIFVKILRISDRFWFDSAILFLFFFVSLIQVVLSYIVVQNELKKFNISRKEIDVFSNLASCFVIGSALLSFTFSLFYLPLAFLFVGFCFYFCAFDIARHVLSKSKFCLISDGFALFFGIILYALLNKYFDGGRDIVLFVVSPSLISYVSIFYSFLKKSQ